jgi:hypothetical protein
MKSQISPIVEKFADELRLQVHGSPFHAAEGLELWKQGRDPDTLICIGYILGPEETAIYRRIDSKRDVFCRNKLWFFYGWLIKRRPRDDQHRTLRTVPTSDFTDTVFVAIAKDAFEKEELREPGSPPTMTNDSTGNRTGPARAPQQFDVPVVHFVGEQDGTPERELKMRLTGYFRNQQNIKKAYLAQVRYGTDASTHVALCLRLQNRDQLQATGEAVSKIFGEMFGPHEHLDIIFLDEDQETRLSKSCPSFYVQVTPA